jgi:hypothetical protein
VRSVAVSKDWIELIEKEKPRILKEIVKDAEKTDITKLPDDLINKVAESKFEDLPDDIKDFIILTGGTLKMAREGRISLTKKEFIEAANEFYVQFLLEYLVRKGFLKRLGKWSYKTMLDLEYEPLKEISREVDKDV